MKQSDEFPEIGKKLPYQEPKDFFDQISAKTLERAKQHKRGQEKRLIFWRSVAVAASLAAIVFLGFLIQNSGRPDEIVNVQEMQADTSIISGQNQQMKKLPIVEHVKNDVAVKSAPEIKSTEDMNDVLADLSDEELMQLAAMYKADPFTDESMQ